MADSDTASRGMSRPGSKRRALAAGRRIALFGAGFGFLAILPAQAQYALPPWAYPYYHGGYYRGEYPPPPGPPGDEGPMNGAPGYFAPRAITAADIRRRVTRLGFRLLARPRRKGNIFLAEARDPNGADHRLVFDAVHGRLLENTKLPPLAKR